MDSMDSKEFIQLMKNRIAELTANSSTMRKRKAGTIARTRSFLKCLDINKFKTQSKKQFIKELNRATRNLKNELPSGTDWGISRKVLNLFLRDICYNKYLCEHLKLSRIISWLEIPLDKDVAKGIKKHFPSKVPKNFTIKRLELKESTKFQKAATIIAKKEKIARVHLDLLYWRNENEK